MTDDGTREMYRTKEVLLYTKRVRLVNFRKPRRLEARPHRDQHQERECEERHHNNDLLAVVHSLMSLPRAFLGENFQRVLGINRG
jgi:hypothetical protein